MPKNRWCINCHTHTILYGGSDTLGAMCVGIGLSGLYHVPVEDTIRLCVFKKNGKVNFVLHLTPHEAEVLGVALIRTTKL